MTGHVIMEISESEMIAAVQFYFNKSVFDAILEMRKHHRATVIAVRQRSGGRFVIEFDGLPEPDDAQDESTDDA